MPPIRGAVDAACAARADHRKEQITVASALFDFQHCSTAEVVDQVEIRTPIVRPVKTAAVAQGQVVGIQGVYHQLARPRVNIAFGGIHGEVADARRGAVERLWKAQVSDVTKAQVIGIQRIHITRWRLGTTQPQVLRSPKILPETSVAIVVSTSSLNVLIPSLGKAPQRGVIDAVFPAFMGGQFIGTVVQSTIRSHPNIVPKHMHVLNVRVHPSNVVSVGTIRSNSLPSDTAIVGCIQGRYANPNTVRIHVRDSHGKVIEPLINSGSVHVSRGQTRVIVHIVRGAVLTIGVGPIVPLVVAAVKANPTRIAGLALANQGHIDAVRICRSGSNAPSMVVGSSGV